MKSSLSRPLLRRYALTTALATVVVVSGVAYATLGGGVTPIGAPFLLVDVGECEIGSWGGHPCLDDSSTLADIRGGVVRRITRVDAKTRDAGDRGIDIAEAYSDDTGVFWANAERGIQNSRSLNNRGIHAGAVFIQDFRKDSESAFVRFLISRAYLFADRGRGRAGSSGVNAFFIATAIVRPGNDFHAAFFQSGELTTNLGGNNWLPPSFQGPMVQRFLQDTEDIKEVEFAPYTADVDISSVPVGDFFQVHFTVEASAAGGPAEIQAAAKAFFRDPVTSGGGIIVTTDGLTPLNRTPSGPIPRDRAQAQAIQPDGKIVTAGQAFVGTNYDIALARYNSDGSLDSSFGTSGKVTTDVSGQTDIANAVAIQSDGKIVVAGASVPAQSSTNPVDSDIVIVRYQSNGTLDTTFGTGGKLTLDISGLDDVARALVLQTDGRIIVAAGTGVGTERDFALVRIHADGALDSSFGTNGKVTTDFNGTRDYAYSTVLQSDGKIVVAGSSDSASASKSDFALARYLPDGSMDSTFGNGGKVTTDVLTASDSAQALALQSDGKLVAAGWSFTGTHNNFSLVRFNVDGSLDSAFGTDGKVNLDFASSHDESAAVAIQADGKIVVGGNTLAGAQRDFAIARLNANGTADNAFGTNGRVTADFAGAEDRITAIALQGDGKILATGFAATATGDDFAMLRLVR